MKKRRRYHKKSRKATNDAGIVWDTLNAVRYVLIQKYAWSPDSAEKFCSDVLTTAANNGRIPTD